MNVINRKYAHSVLAVAAAALLLGGCASSPNTSSSADSSVNFQQYKSYGFMEQLKTDKAQYQSIESTYLKDALSQEMAARGFVKSSEPDLVINFGIDTKEKTRSRPAAGGSFYGDSYYGYGVGYGGGTYIDQYTEGHLNIVVVDPAANQVVWEGRAKGRITRKDEQDVQATLYNAVSEVFQHFPVPAPIMEAVSYTAQ